jgi:hypothetical protein
MDLSIPPGPTPMEEFLGLAFLVLCLAGPIGLVALRHHFSGARGRLRTVRNLLVLATVASSPVVAGLALIVVAGGVEAFATLWDLLKSAW